MNLFINASTLARLANVNRSTVVRWIEKGLLKGAFRPTGTRNWCIPLPAANQFIKNSPTTTYESHHL